MNTNTRKSSLKILAAALLLAGSASAQAADGVAYRMVTGVGNVIAAQGNAAFQEIRAEVGRNLAERINAWLADPELAQAVPAADAGIEDLVGMHRAGVEAAQ